MIRPDRQTYIAIFEDTMKHCKSDKILADAIHYSTENQRLIPENEPLSEAKISAGKKRFPQKAAIIVSRKRTYEAASAYTGESVAVLNFASASNPGGGVANGARAQEECLCRTSTLYANLRVPAMWSGFYQPHRDAQDPLHNDDIIYTPKVIVFKSDTDAPKLLPEKDRYSVNVITCAAPNLRSHPSNMHNPSDGESVSISSAELQALHEKRLRRILDVAVEEGNEVIILGAFGCGAFQNDPHVVAAAAKAVLPEYRSAFRTIEFAIYCSPRPQDSGNYDAFRTTLANL